MYYNNNNTADHTEKEGPASLSNIFLNFNVHLKTRRRIGMSFISESLSIWRVNKTEALKCETAQMRSLRPLLGLAAVDAKKKSADVTAY